MDVNLDDDIRANRARFQAEPMSSASRWVLIITIGVFLGTMASWVTQRGIDYILVRVALSEWSKQSAMYDERVQKRQEDQNKLNAMITKQKQIENAKRQAGLRQATETCNFWRDAYQKEPSSQNKMYMEQACSLVRDFR